MVLGKLKQAIEERKLVKHAEKRIREKEIRDLADRYVKEYGLSKREAIALAKREKKREEVKKRGNPFLAITRFFAPPEVVARKQAERSRELMRKKEEFTRTNPPSWIMDSSAPSWLLDSGGPNWLLDDYQWEGNRKKRSRRGGGKRK